MFLKVYLFLCGVFMWNLNVEFCALPCLEAGTDKEQQIDDKVYHRKIDNGSAFLSPLS